MAPFLCLVGLAAAFTAQADPGPIRINVSPDISLLTPSKDLANVAVEVHGSKGRPAGPVDLAVRLTAPPPGPLVSTDFPLIEGTPLIDMNLSGVPGRLSLNYVFPIRGAYRLDVTAADGEGRRWRRSLELGVRENSARVAFVTGFAVALFILGFTAGRLFSLPPGGAAMLMVALLVGAGAGASMNPEPSDRGGPENTLEVTPARVGAMSAIRWRAADREPAPAQVTLRVVQLEKGREIFRLNRLPTDGDLDLSFQFTDASPHEVTVTTYAPGRERLSETKRTVHVDSATPPLSIRIRPVLLFMLVVLAGLATGRISKRRRTPLRWTAKRVKMDPKEAS